MCCNVYNDAPALRGLLETSAPYFDNLFVVNSGPGGARSTDGTIELCEQYGATVVFDDMNRGFGAIRTRLIHDCGCSFAFLLDADERFFPSLPVMHCEGVDRYPAQNPPNLSSFKKPQTCDQGRWLKEAIMTPGVNAVRTIRRHWFDFAMTKPAENWLLIKDYQLRVVRNHPEIGYVPNRKMHEQLRDNRTGEDPVFVAGDDYMGPFHDHFHLHFRRTQPGYKEEREKNYQRLERGEEMIP